MKVLLLEDWGDLHAGSVLDEVEELKTRFRGTWSSNVGTYKVSIPKKLGRRESSWYFCTNCLPDHRFCGELNDIYFIAHDISKNKYYIGDIRGHADMIYEFPFTPTKSPTNLVEEPEHDNDPRWAAEGAWLDQANEAEKTFLFDPETGSEIFELFRKKRWKQDKHGYLYLFVLHHVGLIIEKYLKTYRL